MPTQKPTPFDFWWPTSETGRTLMLFALTVIGFLVFIRGCVVERLDYQSGSSARSTFLEILVFHVGLSVAGWYVILNVGRFVYTLVLRSESFRAWKETRREKAELVTLRRRSEIKKLKEELGGNDGNGVV